MTMRIGALLRGLSRLTLAVVLLLCLGESGIAYGQGQVDVKAAKSYFTDVELIDQHGQKQRFYTDLLEGKVVLINSFFSSCQAVCPVMAQRLAKIQADLGDRLGSEVHILSITVDVENDSPDVLARYAERWGAEKGWYFLSGDPENVRFALKKLGQLVENPDDHTTILLVGNEPTGLWKKANGLAPASDLAAVLESVLEDKG